MIYSTNTVSLITPEDVYTGLSRIIEAGFPAIDLTLSMIQPLVEADDYKQTAKAIRKFVEDKGAIFNQVHCPFRGGVEFYSTKTVPLLPRYLEFAALIGAKWAIVHPIHGENYQKNKDMVYERNIAFYKSLAPYAKEFGIKIALENMWQRAPIANHITDDIYADPRELAKAYDDLADPEAFTVCLDIGHVAICGRDPSDALRTLGSRVGALHVHDVDYVHDNHTLPGQGMLDWEDICKTIAEIGYSGDFTLETDCFMNKYPSDLKLTALKMMNDVAKYYSGRVEFYKAEMQNQ